MIEIICQGKSPSETKAKCMVAEILLKELLIEKKISTDMAINLLNAIGGICIEVTEDMDESPSVTPQEPQTFKWCTDCKEYDQEKHCCHRYSKVIRDTVEEMKQEQEPILDKIRAEIEKWHKDGTNWSDIRLMEIEDILDKEQGRK